MSSALAIASVTAVLRDLLINGLIDQDLTPSLGDVKVTALPPDRIVTGDKEQSQLNLFLYQVSPNPGWRNVGLPSRDGQGQSIAAPPLAVDLHYLLSAYGAQDFHAEILLGYAMQLLHETPVLGREAIRTALGAPGLVSGGSGLPATLAALSTSALADQIEQIKIAPQTLNTEETSKLWTALQARYRASAAYHISVVLIDSRQRVRAPLPVLRRGEEDQGVEAAASANLPVIEELLLPHNQSSALMEDKTPPGKEGIHAGKITLRVKNIEGFSAVRFSHKRLSISFEIAKAEVQLADDKVTVPVKIGQTLPTGSTTPPWIPGSYSVAIVVDRGSKRFSSVEKNFSLAPRIIAIAPPNPIAPDGNGNVTLTITTRPPIKLARVNDTTTRFDQKIELFLGGPFVRPILPKPPPANAPAAQSAATDTLIFTFPVTNADSGEYMPRLRVDDVEMPVVDWIKEPPPPEFDSSHKVTIA